MDKTNLSWLVLSELGISAIGRGKLLMMIVSKIDR